MHAEIRSPLTFDPRPARDHHEAGLDVLRIGAGFLAGPEPEEIEADIGPFRRSGRDMDDAPMSAPGLTKRGELPLIA